MLFLIRLLLDESKVNTPSFSIKVEFSIIQFEQKTIRIIKSEFFIEIFLTVILVCVRPDLYQGPLLPIDTIILARAQSFREAIRKVDMFIRQTMILCPQIDPIPII